MKKSPKFSPEVRERAVHMVAEARGEYPSQWATIESIAAKIGCTAQTLSNWVHQHERWAAAAWVGTGPSFLRLPVRTVWGGYPSHCGRRAKPCPAPALADDLSPIERIDPTPAHRVGRSRCPAPMAVLDQNERRVCSGIRMPLEHGQALVAGHGGHLHDAQALLEQARGGLMAQVMEAQIDQLRVVAFDLRQ